MVMDGRRFLTLCACGGEPGGFADVFAGEGAAQGQPGLLCVPIVSKPEKSLSKKQIMPYTEWVQSSPT